MMKDPVCGMEIKEHSSECTDFQGQHFCFCSKQCMQQFQSNPRKFAGHKGGLAKSAKQKK